MSLIATAPHRNTFGRPRTVWRSLRVLVRRNAVHIRRDPMQLSDATVQPVLFTLLFAYVLGSGVVIAGGSYIDFALAGFIALNLTTSTIGTAVGLVNDLNTGVIDRFRTLPMWHTAVLVSRSLSDLMSSALCLTMVVLTALVVGWRPNAGALSVAAGLLLPLLFSWALTWGTICFGLVSKSVESAQGMGLVLLFPLAIVSNALVPTQGMPGWLQAVANWNPVSAMAAAVRRLLGNPNPSAALRVWPMQHPVAASLAWSGLMLIVFVPLATLLYRRRTVA